MNLGTFFGVEHTLGQGGSRWSFVVADDLECRSSAVMDGRVLSHPEGEKEIWKKTQLLGTLAKRSPRELPQ